MHEYSNSDQDTHTSRSYPYHTSPEGHLKGNAFTLRTQWLETERVSITGVDGSRLLDRRKLVHKDLNLLLSVNKEMRGSQLEMACTGMRRARANFSDIGYGRLLDRLRFRDWLQRDHYRRHFWSSIRGLPLWWHWWRQSWLVAAEHSFNARDPLGESSRRLGIPVLHLALFTVSVCLILQKE